MRSVVVFPFSDRRARLRRTATLLVVAVLCGGIAMTGSPSAHAAQDPGLVRKINSVMADPRVQRAKSSAVVLDATTGERLYSRNGIVPRIPASNTKILTAAAALETLGEKFTFHTDVLRRSKVVNGVLGGPLYLKGYGDPTTRQSDFAALARRVKAADVRAIERMPRLRRYARLTFLILQ